MRLVKYLAHAGVASRRAAERLIAEGRVSVGAEVVRDPARDVVDADEVAVDGRPLHGAEPRATYALNKPAGVVSTASDTHGRPTVVELLGRTGARVYPVGRLDADTTGLILLTNDGELANLLTHPRHEVLKVYRARVAGGAVGRDALARLAAGVELEDGMTAPAGARLLAPNVIELELREGRKRQVRRMCEAVGHRVLALQRVRFGPLELGDLPDGAHRALSDGEVDALRAAAHH